MIARAVAGSVAVLGYDTVASSEATVEAAVARARRTYNTAHVARRGRADVLLHSLDL